MMRVLLLLQAPLASLLMFVSGECLSSTGKCIRVMYALHDNFTYTQIPSGIYLMHGGYCLSEYTVVSINGLTATNPLHCILPAGSSSGTGGGQWTTGPDNTAVECGGSGSSPLTCSQTLDPTNTTLYYKKGAFPKKKLYTCTISGQNISVQINRE